MGVYLRGVMVLVMVDFGFKGVYNGGFWICFCG